MIHVSPGIFGFGTHTVGGARATSPSIYKVTNLNDSGLGSFRDAVSANNRVVIFEVSGVIELSSWIEMNGRSNISVYGETSPGDGITLKNRQLRLINCNDIFFSHIAIRPGNAVPEETIDCLQLIAPNDSIVFKNMSFSWSQDENCSSPGSEGVNNTNITFWNCLIAEPHGYLGNGHNFNFLGYSENNSNFMFRGCAFSHGSARNPNLPKHSALINSLCYNKQYHFAGFSTTTGGKLVMAGNKDIVGANSVDPDNNQATRSAIFINAAVLDGEVYLDDNRCLNYDPDDPWKSARFMTGSPIGEDDLKILYPPFTMPDDYYIFASSETKQYILDQCGKKPWARDAIDQKMIDEIENETGSWVTEPSVSYGVITPETRTLSTPSDPFFVQSNGYTNIEEWIFNRRFEYVNSEKSVLYNRPSETGGSMHGTYPAGGTPATYINYIREGTANHDGLSTAVYASTENHNMDSIFYIPNHVKICSILEHRIAHAGNPVGSNPYMRIFSYVNNETEPRSVSDINANTGGGFKVAKVISGFDPPLVGGDKVKTKFQYLELGNGHPTPPLPEEVSE